MGPVLRVVGCAAPPVLRIGDIVGAAAERGWQVHLVLTPTAARWLATDLAALGDLTGSPVRSEYGMPGDGGASPTADAVLVAPATANSVNKCAAGISDTLALGVMNEAVGRGVPLAVVPAISHDFAHPAYRRSVGILRSAGVSVIDPLENPDLFVAAEERLPFRWEAGLDALEAGGRPPSQARTAAS